MAYNLAGLTAYTEQDAKKLIYKVIAGDDISKMMNVQTGIKSAETINIVQTEGVWQAATNCNPTASGDTTFTQRTLTVGAISVVLEWCEEQDVELVTLWLLSTDNLRRSESELIPLLGIIEQTAVDLAKDGRWKLQAVGALDGLPQKVQQTLKDAESATDRKSVV